MTTEIICATILGSGSSSGVPRINNDWGQCDPSNPKNRRRRQALLIEQNSDQGRTSVLVDTPPDIRTQLLEVGITKVDGVILTHQHADHLHGLIDLRSFSDNQKQAVPFFIQDSELDSVTQRFEACFIGTNQSIGRGFLNPVRVTAGSPIAVLGSGGQMIIESFNQQHGESNSLGIRIKGFAYSVDFNDLDSLAMSNLKRLDTWVLDCLRHETHPSHVSVGEAIRLVEELRPKRAILNGLSPELDFEELRLRLPPGIEPAFDGMKIEIY